MGDGQGLLFKNARIVNKHLILYECVLGDTSLTGASEEQGDILSLKKFTCSPFYRGRVVYQGDKHQHWSSSDLGSDDPIYCCVTLDRALKLPESEIPLLK